MREYLQVPGVMVQKYILGGHNSIIVGSYMICPCQLSGLISCSFYPCSLLFMLTGLAVPYAVQNHSCHRAFAFAVSSARRQASSLPSGLYSSYLSAKLSVVIIPKISIPIAFHLLLSCFNFSPWHLHYRFYHFISTYDRFYITVYCLSSPTRTKATWARVSVYLIH